MAQWIETRLRYDKVDERGKPKKVNEPYLVDALSFAEAEARIIKEMQPFISGDFTVSAVKKARIDEVIGDIDDGKYFLAKVGYITIDEKTGYEKPTVSRIIICEPDFQSAFGAVIIEMRKSVSDWHIISIAETPIIGIFPADHSGNK